MYTTEKHKSSWCSYLQKKMAEISMAEKLGAEDNVMEKSSRKKRRRFRSVIWRQKVANNRRFCMTRIRRMEKQIQDMRTECFDVMKELTNLRAKILQDLKELKETVVYLECSMECRFDRISMNMEEENKKKTKEDEDDEANSLVLKRSSLNFPVTPTDTNSSDDDTSDGDTSTGDTIDGDSQITLTPGFHTSEGQRVHESPTEEEALLMEKQWEEWMNEQEMKGNHIIVKPDGQQNTEEERKAPPVPEKQTKQKVNGEGTMKKLKTYISNLFSPHTWEKFEDED